MISYLLEDKKMFYSEKLKASDCFGLVKTTCSSKSVDIKECELDGFKTKGKTIIILCGNNTKNTNKAASYAVNCYNWLSGYSGKRGIDLYSVYYPGKQPLLSDFSINPSFDYEGLFTGLIKPQLYTKNKLKSADEIIDSVKDITFFGHSMGCYIMNELTTHLTKFMKDNNFTKEEINKVLSCMVFIGYSPYKLVHAPIKKIYIAPLYDSLGSTKLVYDKMQKSGRFLSSNPNVNIEHISKLRELSQHDYVKQYRKHTKNENVQVFASKNTLIITPNLLYFDGIKEDHNFAGIINYRNPSPYKTDAGKITTDIFMNALSYSITENRRKFSTKQLFNESIKIVESASEGNKEL